MTGPFRAVVVLSLLGGLTTAPPIGATPPGTSLTDEHIERFLETARIVSRRPAPAGVTMSIRATLTDGTLTHDAQIQHVDISKALFSAGKASEAGFRDSYLFNIAGSRLARLLGMTNVPISVARKVDGKPASVTWWIDEVQMDEHERIKRKVYGPAPLRTINQLLTMQVFDELIQNRDRNRGNMLWTKDWTLWLIDHTRAFRPERELRKPDSLKRIERGFLERLRAVPAQAVMDALTRDGLLMTSQVEALLARRDRLLKHFDERIARLGEAAVVF